MSKNIADESWIKVNTEEFNTWKTTPGSAITANVINPTYICETHGEVTGEWIDVRVGKAPGLYCNVCWAEWISENCKPLTRK